MPHRHSSGIHVDYETKTHTNFAQKQEDIQAIVWGTIAWGVIVGGDIVRWGFTKLGKKNKDFLLLSIHKKLQSFVQTMSVVVRTPQEGHAVEQRGYGASRPIDLFRFTRV